MIGRLIYDATKFWCSASILRIQNLCIMKKLLLLLIVPFLSFEIAADAEGREKQTWSSQLYKYEIRIGWGMPSDAPSAAYYDNPIYSSDGTLSSIYSPTRGALYSTGGFSAEFGLNLRKWFTLAIQTSLCGLWSDVYDYTHTDVLYKDRGVIFNLAPQARFNWVKRPIFRMYSSIGIGFTVVSYSKRNTIEKSLQFVPIGIAVGKDVFFFAEAGGGVGSNFLGYHLGMGYRF